MPRDFRAVMVPGWMSGKFEKSPGPELSEAWVSLAFESLFLDAE